jgi:hypothetical protein
LVAWYAIVGVPVVVRSDLAEALDRIDETYVAFRQEAGPLAGALAIEVARQQDGRAVWVRDSDGYAQSWPTAEAAVVDALGRIVQGVLARLHARGVYAIHAGAMVYRGAALIVAGKSGQGKTTLVLGLLRRGLGMLSDEFAIVEPETQHILPYRRSLHIRPGTPELIPELAFLRDRPQHQLGGGIEWALTLADLAQVFPAALAPAAPLRYVLLLDGAPRPDAAPEIVPVPAALATMELLRGTWAASVAFADGLARISRLMDGVTCGRLRAGELGATLDCVSGWLEAQHGRA